MAFPFVWSKAFEGRITHRNLYRYKYHLDNQTQAARQHCIARAWSASISDPAYTEASRTRFGRVGAGRKNEEP